MGVKASKASKTDRKVGQSRQSGASKGSRNNSRTNSMVFSKEQPEHGHFSKTVAEMSEEYPFGHSVMNHPATPDPDEEERIQKLLSYDILDSERKSSFDDLVLMASTICQTPMAAISLIDQTRQWFKAEVGLGCDSTSREAAFCTYTIKQKDIFLVPSPLQDPRFATNEFVLGGPKLRFYAGAPIIADDGHALGTICTLDNKPHAELREDQRRCLQAISRQIFTLIDARVKLRELKIAVTELRAAEASLSLAKAQAEAANVSSVEHLILSPDGFEAFRVHLRQEHSEENLLFFQECAEFRLKTSRKMQNLQARQEAVESERGSTQHEVLKQMTSMDLSLLNAERLEAVVASCYALLRIYLIYLHDHAPRQVNLSAAVREALVKELQPLTQLLEAHVEHVEHVEEADLLEWVPAQRVEQLVAAGGFAAPDALLEEAQAEVLKLLKEDCYRRFKSSPHYAALLRKVGEMGKLRLARSQTAQAPPKPSALEHSVSHPPVSRKNSTSLTRRD